jgi:anaerobic dimethyl sulfoxide reductase subunit A
MPVSHAPNEVTAARWKSARITKRIRPGVISIPQGAWYTPDDRGVCQRGCINILTSQKATPLAHGNAQHTILVEVQKA